MKPEYQILAALGLDLAFGDPRWLPHPVRLIGGFAAVLEAPLRRAFPSARLAGLAAVILVITVTMAAAWVVIRGAGRLHPLAGEVSTILILYFCFAARDLADHAMKVYAALSRGDLLAARRQVALMVGRDTAKLNEEEVARAAVESVAENTVDGVVAPLFFAFLAGPVGALVYKAVSTLDSTFGYRNERYIEFGRASAKLDDVANYLPARLTVPLMVLAALPLGGALRTWRICCRDGRRHGSPNSGLAEAAMSGALGVQLGGPVTREGRRQEMPLLGAPAPAPEAQHIPRACVLMLATTFLAAGVFLAARWGIVQLVKT